MAQHFMETLYGTEDRSSMITTNVIYPERLKRTAELYSPMKENGPS